MKTQDILKTCQRQVRRLKIKSTRQVALRAGLEPRSVQLFFAGHCHIGHGDLEKILAVLRLRIKSK